MNKRVRRLLSLVLVTSMLATSAVPALATDGSTDMNAGVSVDEGIGSDSSPEPAEQQPTEPGAGSKDSEGSGDDSASTENGGEAGDESGQTEDSDSGEESEENAEDQEENEGDSKVPGANGGSDSEPGRTDGVFDPQPEEPEDVQEWVDAYVSSDYSEAAKPYWEHEVDSYLIPEGWECVFIADDGYFGASYFTLRSLYPPEDEEGDDGEEGDAGNEEGTAVITAENVTVPLGDASFNLLDGVSAADEEGEDISDQIVVLSDGGFDVEAAGEYTVIYAIIDEEDEIVTAAQRIVTVEEAEEGEQPGEGGEEPGDGNGGELPEPAEPVLNADLLYLLVDSEKDERPHYAYVPGAFLEGVTAYDAEGNDISDLIEITSYGEFGEEPAEGELLPMGEYVIELAVVQDGEVILEGTRDIMILMGFVPMGGGITYLVRWYDWDDRLVSIQILNPGERAQEPRTNDRDGYAFEGWSLNDVLVDEDTWKSVNENMDLKAEYRRLGTKLITVEYLLPTGVPIEAPFVAVVAIEATDVLTVPSPVIPGYTPDRPTVTIDLSLYDADHTETVVYDPSDGYIWVRYYQQGLDGNYAEVAGDSYRKDGLVGDTVVPDLKTYTGFEQINNPTGTILADSSSEIRVYFDRLSYAVYYDSNGGYFIEPQSYLYGQTINYPAPNVGIRRGGYNFTDWTVTPAQYQGNLPTTMPDTDLYLTANWTLGQPVRYTVMYWVEQADDSAQTYDQELAANGGVTKRGYDYVGAVSTYTAYADSYVNAPSGTAGVTFPDNLASFTSRNTSKTESNVKVSGDGDTIINVYYDRNLYVVQLSTESYVPGNSSSTGIFHNWTYGGVTYGNGTSDVNRYLVKGKYGDNISASWPNSGPTPKGSDLQFSGWSNTRLGSTTLGTKRHEMTDSLTEVASSVASPYKLYCAFRGNYTYNINYHLQAVDQADTPYTNFPRDANLSQTLQGSSNSTWSAKLVKGFKLVSPDSQSGSTINFYFQRNRYKIDFSNGGVVNTSKTINNVHYEKPLSSYANTWIPADSDAPQGLEGYRFAGWTTQDGTPFNFNTAKMPAGNLVLFANWERPSFDITFYLNDGTNTVYATDSVLLHDPIPEPADPVRPGYDFLGWYREQEPTGTSLKYVFDFPITGPETLYARWGAEDNIKYTVKYFIEGEANPFYSYEDYGNMDVQPIAYALGKEDLEKYVPDGYFVDQYQKSITLSPNEADNVIEFFYKKAEDVPYWVHYVYEDEAGIQHEIASMKSEVTDYNIVTEDFLPVSGYWTTMYQITLPLSLDTSFNHIWFKYNANAGETYRVEHYLQKVNTEDGGYPTASELGPEYIEILTAPIASVVNADIRTYVGFTYAPGISEPTGTVTTLNQLVLRVYYTRDKYTVNYESNGGSAIAPQLEVPFESLVDRPSDPVRKGYTFLGWYSDPAFTIPWDFDVNTMPAHDMTLYAKWVVRSDLTLYFAYEGADSGNSEASRPATFDTPLGTLPTPGRHGYNFGGWFDKANGQGKKYVGTDLYDVDGDLTLYAYWIPEQRTITYYANGANGVSPQAETLNFDVLYTVKSAADLSMVHPYSWRVFNGWAIFDGTVYQAGHQFTVKDDMDLFAQWVYDGTTTFDVTYDANGGLGGYVATNLIPESTHTVLGLDSPVNISRYGFDFLGWNTEADGTGTMYQPNGNFEVLRDVTLYAQWKHNNKDFFNITYKPNEFGKNPDKLGPNIIPGEVDTVLAIDETGIEARYEGWLFDGWNTEADGSGISYEPGDEITLNGSVTVYAQWKHDGETYYSVIYLPGGGQGGTIDSNLIPGYPYVVKTQDEAVVVHTSDWKFRNWTTNGISPVLYGEGELIEHLDSSLFLYAEWDFVGTQIAVTYDANRGEGGFTELFNPGFQYTVRWHDDPLVDISRYGHKFIEWNTEPDGSGVRYAQGNWTSFTEDITLYAQWQHDGKTYVNVIYDANGGVGTDSFAVIPGEDHVVLSDTTVGISRLGHAFRNWNIQADGAGASYVAGDIVRPLNTDITLYARWKWDNKTYVTLSYDANGGTGGADINVIPGETVSVRTAGEASVHRDGHDFQGWNIVADGSGKAYAAGDGIKVDVNTTLYAQWEWDKTTYVTLKYDANGGTGSHTVSNIIPGDTRPAIDPADATSKISRYGFEFQGWNTQKDGKGISYAINDSVKVDGNTTLYAQWKHDGKTFYKVYYMPNGGTGNYIEDVIPGEEYTILKLSDTGITRSGYEFKSWNTLANGTGVVRNPGDKIVVNSAVLLHADWNQIVTYRVTYDANGGQGGYTGPAIVAGQSDTVAALSLTGITRNGHKFEGWKTADGTLYAPGSSIVLNSNVTLYAQWTWDGKTLVNITYHANGGTGGGNGPSLRPGEEDTILAPSDASLNVARKHHDFLGWTTNADGTGTLYQPGETEQLHDSMNLYAQWKWDGTYVYVTYNSNGGTDAGNIVMSLDEEVKIPAIPGDTHTIFSADDLNFARRGHNFLGWGTEADVETPPVVYLPGNVITVDDDVDLYASWYYDAVSLITITYDANGGTGTNTVSVVPGRSVSVRDAASHGIARKGYEFVGWALNPEGPATIIPDNEPSKIYYYKTNNNVILYAVWKVDDTAEVTVRYFPNGAENATDYINGGLRPGSAYTVLDPAKAPLSYSKYGFNFTGWTTNPDGSGDSYSKEEVITLTGEDIDLYAQWKHDGKTYYQVFYMPNGGTGYALDNVIPGDSYTVKDGASATVKRDGYLMAYWNTLANGSGMDYAGGDVIVPTSHLYMYAQWVGSNVTYRVAYDANEGKGSYVDANVSPVGRYTVRTASQTGVSRDGYNFANWDTQASGIGISYAASEKIILKGDTDLYAQWDYKEGHEFKVTYDSNGADGAVTSYDGGGYTYRQKHTVVSDSVTGFTYTNAVFNSWTTNPDGTGTVYLPLDEIEMTKDITLYAKWEMIPQDRDITYHSNYGKDSEIHTVYNPLDEVHIVKGIDFVGGDNKVPGLTFRNWNTEPNGSGVTHLPGLVLPPSGDITLYAQWDYDGFSTYRVTFMPNTVYGGIGTPKIEIHQPGDRAIDPAINGISHPTLTFAGWDTEMDGTGTRYAAGDEMYRSGATVLFAQWQ